MAEVARVDLEELRALAEQATPGPWFSCVNDLIGGRAVHTVDKPSSQLNRRESIGVADMFNRDADAAFIAACDPQTVLALLDENERLREALVRIERWGGGAPEIAADCMRDIAVTALAPFEDSP